MKIIGRFAVVAIGIGWYVAIRNVIYLYFLGHGTGTARKEPDFFDWWWSWLIAIPASLLSAAIVVGTLAAIGWIFFGGDDEESPEAQHPAHRRSPTHHKPPTVQ